MMIDIDDTTVLIADDAPNILTTVQSMLKVRYGSKFHFATNGSEAWRIFKKEPIGLAIFDYTMPTLSDVELLDRIREDWG